MLCISRWNGMEYNNNNIMTFFLFIISQCYENDLCVSSVRSKRQECDIIYITKTRSLRKSPPFLSQWPCLEPYRAAFLDNTFGRHRPTNGRKCCLGRPVPRLWDGARGTPRLDPWEREIISLLCLWFHLCKRRALRTPINSPRSPTKPAGFASSVAKGFSGRFGKTDLWCWKETNFTFLKKRLVLGCFLYCHYLIDEIDEMTQL